MAKLLLALIALYQATLSRLILAVLGPVCRFTPSCSRYAAACISGHGALRGSLLSVRRLCKCHPFHPGGFDPPPAPAQAARQAPSPTTSPPAAPGRPSTPPSLGNGPASDQ
jgi:putative membrane protein insertion efficiency factor